MANMTLNRTIIDMKTSRSGRVLIPRLRCWLGERATITNGEVEITDDGYPDFTSTFQSERTVVKMNSTMNQSQAFGRSVNQAPVRKNAKLESKSKPLKQQVQNTTQNTTKSGGSKRVSSPSKITRSAKPPKRKKISKNSDSPLKTTAKILKKRSPNKKSVQQHDQTNKENAVPIDIWAPEFQPYVLLRRLLPEELLAICNQQEAEVSDEKNRRQTAKRSRFVKKTPAKKSPAKKSPAKKSPAKKTSAKKTSAKKTPLKKTSDPSPLYRRTRTVKETQQMLQMLHSDKATDDFVDEAAATEGYFQTSPSKAMTIVAAAIDILNDDFGESEDNLSIRTLSEREFSPVSFAVSPVGSAHETDNEHVFDDGLLRGSPRLGDPSSYQKAALLHRTVADRNKLRKKTKKTRRKREEETAISLPKPLSAGRLFQPRVMKALEKDLKKKSKSSKPWDFSSYYRGNLLHVSVNSDSDTSEDSIDSISVEF